MLKQQFKEDEAEIQAHFAERVQAYVELGETPEQAVISARQKFGETEEVLTILHRQQTLRSVLRSPISRGLVCAAGYLLITFLTKATLGKSDMADFVFGLTFCLYMGLTLKSQRTTCKKA